MQSSAIVTDVDVCLDIFGQQPRLNIHTQICLCFPLPDAFAQSRVISTLRSGLERLTASFPWVAGQVIGEGSGDGNTGVFKIKALGNIPRLVVKDLRNDPLAPTMQALRQANFPMKKLDESVIAPRNTFPGTDVAEETESNSPVFLLQANFIVGGLVLTFLGPELASHLVKPIPGTGGSTQTPVAPPPRCVWASFVLSPASLAALKSIALETRSPGSSYVSTDDALSAFVWQSIMRARLARLPPTTEATFARAVDVRRYVDVPATYTGIVQNMTYTTYQLRKLVALPLGEIASALRVALDLKTTILPFHTRALATYLHSQADKSMVSPASSIDLSVDVMLSSWAKTDCYSLNFNLGLGFPEAVRRPRFAPLQSFVYFMPRACDGEIAVAMCLREEDMEQLRVDEEFVKYARHDG
ncbi:hypothetical protein VE01_08649 [Pseudogymnoascus verrucosus]|uniref:Trichothecene 3-O-acetyltransferase-like N-terminal domain-containing protein n=1 Tax=Pseudogymnoascus verrucosus TaxID=342668 RepID=A0A1B8GCF8_9PEZI|nr:uncharacterized protein VE01_08649 [Pseudogymnoascus verrucosus]OBT93467.1 hypothetical protein VE01_08649 [Pseudogymnoascus verrucosus]